jgi:putative endonuclease
MRYWVYILYSPTAGRYYCGFTDNVERRVAQHNDPDYRSTRTTKVFKGPWEVSWTREMPSRAEAMKLEKQIKKRGIGRYLKDVQS